MLGFFSFWWNCELLLQWVFVGCIWSKVLEVKFVNQSTSDYCLQYISPFECFLITLWSRFVFGVTALLPLLTSAVAVLVKEQPTLGTARGQTFSFARPEFLESSKQSIIQLWVSVRQPSIFLPTLFIFLWQATPQSDSAMFYFTYVHLLNPSIFNDFHVLLIFSSQYTSFTSILISYPFQHKFSRFYPRVFRTCQARYLDCISAWCWTL